MPRADRTAIRWFVPIAAPDPSLTQVIAGLHESPTRQLSAQDPDWSPVPAPGPRRVFCRIAPDYADYLKFFPEDRFSIRRRAGLFIWPTPARRHHEWTRILESLGVRVAPLIAAGELPPTRPLRQPASFIITRSPIGALTVEAALRDHTLAPDECFRIARELLALARRLHQHGIARIDLRATNVLIYSAQEPLVLFDIDRFVRLGSFRSRARIAKDDERVRAACTRLLQGTGLTLRDLA